MTEVRLFPDGFLWGAATAGHQIEGGNTASDLWWLEHTDPTIFVEPSGDTCDSYHRYDDDIELMKSIGLNSYRFSLEWARIEPEPGQISSAALDHYKRVMEALHAADVAPAVTFNHFSAPRWFGACGGWLHPDSSKRFAEFCSTAAAALADGMRLAFTLNEPQVSTVFRQIPGAEPWFAAQDVKSKAMHDAASAALGVEAFRSLDYPDLPGMTPNLIAGHEAAVEAIKAVRGDLPVGVTLSVTDFQPASDDSPYAEVRRRAYGEWLEVIRRSGDFAGVQSYRMIRLPGSGEPYPPLAPLPYVDPDDRSAQMPQPAALANTVEYVHAETGKPIVVSENGIETDDDRRRQWYIPAALTELHGAIERGVPVWGYYHWSLIDNFEWTRGYEPRFGLAEVDRTTFARTLKPSAAIYGEIVRRNGIKG